VSSYPGLTLVTRDPTVRRYPIDTMWIELSRSAVPTAAGRKNQQLRSACGNRLHRFSVLEHSA
jgi:hypothetical protein